MRIMAGLDRPTEGRVLADGVDVTGVPVRQRNVAMVYQQFINYPSMTVFDNIASPPAARREQHRRQGHGDGGAAAYRSSGPALSFRAVRRPAATRALARALVKNAPLILLDEPLVNLDYKLREELRDELSALFAQGRSTVIYATTEPGEALLLGGYTAVLDEGRLLQYGPTAEVFHRPSSIRVARAFSDPPHEPVRRAAAGRLRAAGRGARPLPAGAGDITAGLRAGALDVHEQPGHIALDSVVKLAEISGSDTFVHAETAAGEVVAQLPGVHRCTLDQRLRLYFDPAQTYAFGADGALLAAPGWLSAPVAKEAR